VKPTEFYRPLPNSFSIAHGYQQKQSMGQAQPGSRVRAAVEKGEQSANTAAPSRGEFIRPVKASAAVLACLNNLFSSRADDLAAGRNQPTVSRRGTRGGIGGVKKPTVKASASVLAFLNKDFAAKRGCADGSCTKITAAEGTVAPGSSVSVVAEGVPPKPNPFKTQVAKKQREQKEKPKPRSKALQRLEERMRLGGGVKGDTGSSAPPAAAAGASGKPMDFLAELRKKANKGGGSNRQQPAAVGGGFLAELKARGGGGGGGKPPAAGGFLAELKARSGGGGGGDSKPPAAGNFLAELKAKSNLSNAVNGKSSGRIAGGKAAPMDFLQELRSKAARKI
jgi:hypothetical protein